MSERKNPYWAQGEEWSRLLSTSQAGAVLGKSAGAMAKFITHRTDGSELQVEGLLSAKKVGRKWMIRLHRSVLP